MTTKTEKWVSELLNEAGITIGLKSLGYCGARQERVLGYSS